MSPARLTLALLGALLALATTSASAAHAAFGLESFGVTYSTTQAGAHPDVTVSFLTNTSVNDKGTPEPYGQLKDVTVDLPPGVIGNPAAIAQCTDAQMTRDDPPTYYPGDCPAASQVGTIRLAYVGFNDDLSGTEVRRTMLPVYNMAPTPGHPARLAFNFAAYTTIPVTIDIRSDGDYGVRASLRNITNQMTVVGADMTLWGNPSSPANDGVRFPCISSGNGIPSGTCPAATPPLAFMTNPTRCDTELRTRIRIASYQHDVAEAQSEPVKMTGCEGLRFEPEVTVAPTTSQPDAPTGLDVGIRVPQSDLAGRLATPNLRDVSIQLPEGVAINPAAADGLQGCTDAQSGIGRTGDVSCPPASRIGSVEIDTPLLDDPLEGDVFVGAPASDDPASGRMFRIFLAAHGSGVDVRLEGALVPDPQTGRLTATFTDNPQLPFSALDVRLDGGPRAVLSTPMGCTTATTTATLRPWNGGEPVTSTSQFRVSGGACGALPFAPAFSAGSAAAQAGGSSPFTVSARRDAGQAELSTIGLRMPPGLLGNIRSAELCGDAQAAAGACGAGSRIGTATVTSGTGATPLPLQGQVFLTGAYKGAPFGLAVVVPAKAGPYDLGLVVVRARVEVDRKTAALSVASDPMPTILKGVPLRIRSVDIAVDRPGFMLAPTSCAPATIAGEVRSAGGLVSPSSTRFAVGGCAGLAYAPKLALALGGRGQTTDGKHPALAARLTVPAGGANTKRVQVALPLSLALDPDNAQALCEPSAAAADRCPATSIVGRASAESILHVPLTAPVYFVRGERRTATGAVRRTLPKLYIPLKGEGVAIDVHVSSDVEDDQLVTTFDDLPDAPISRFDLELAGGEHGILVVSNADVCAANQTAGADLTAHSRKIVAGEVPMGTPCPLKVLASSHTPSRLRVRVGGLGAGRVVVTGRGLRRTARTLTGATVATVSVPLSRDVRARLAAGGDVRIAVKAAFTPAGAKGARTVTRTVTVHGAKRKAARRR